MNAIICVVTPTELKNISKCIIAKAMLGKLEVTYEGTNQFKETKLSMLVYEY